MELLTIILIWYRVLSQGECQFLFAVRVGYVVVWPIFSTSKMKAFCIYFYQGNITFKNIINLVSFIINSVEYLVINSYSVTVLDNFRKETSDSAKGLFFVVEVFNSLTFILGNPPPPHLHGPPSWMKFWWRYHFDSLNYNIYFFTTSLQVGELCSCFAAAWHTLSIIGHSQYIIFLLYHCQSILLYQCQSILLYQCQSILLYQCQSILQYHCQSILLYHCQSILLYHCQSILLYQCQSILLYQCQSILLYQCQSILLYHCQSILLYHCQSILRYQCQSILLYHCQSILLYHCQSILLYHCQYILLYHCQSIMLYHCQSILMYQCQSILLYQCQSILQYQCQSILLYQCQSILRYQCHSIIHFCHRAL